MNLITLVSYNCFLYTTFEVTDDNNRDSHPSVWESSF